MSVFTVIGYAPVVVGFNRIIIFDIFLFCHVYLFEIKKPDVGIEPTSLPYKGNIMPLY
jgi:hypothetical protein